MPSFIEQLGNTLVPTPRFLRMPATGVVITEHEVRALSLAKSGDEFGVRARDVQELPEGAVQKGEIKRVQPVAEALSALADRTSIHFVNTLLPESRVYLFQTQLPDVSDRDETLRSTLEFKLEENVPLEPSSAIFDYEVLKRGGTRRQSDINVAVYAQETVMPYIEAFRAAGLQILSLDIESEALMRSFIDRDDETTYMILNVERHGVGISIARAGTLYFATAVTFDGAALDQVLLESELAGDNADARVLRRQFGLNDMKQADESAFSRVRSQLNELVSEVNRYYAYWNSRTDDDGNRSHPIERVLLGGAYADARVLTEYLASNLRAPVQRANPWQNVLSFEQTIPEIEYEDALGYASTIGVAMRDPF
jgi:type IV pilus assembly protein PilM